MGYFSELSQELDQGRELPVDTAAFEDEETLIFPLMGLL